VDRQGVFGSYHYYQLWGGIMISAGHIIRMSSVRLLVLLGLFTVPQIGSVVSAAEKTKEQMNGLPCDIPTGQNAAHAEQDSRQTSRLVSGELMQMDGEHFVMKDKNRREVRFQVTETTEKRPIQQGI
jgi:hypothetical protein